VLKEGLTVYRDSQFTSDMRSSCAVKRIGDVTSICAARQFFRDQGPLAHPRCGPKAFKRSTNFYTPNGLRKRCEVLIGMLKLLVR